MTKIDFYTQVPDKNDFTRRLCVKALASGARLYVWTADKAASQKLSRIIWSIPHIGFVPHVEASDRLAGVTPIIVDCADGPFPHDQILVNLRAEVPPFFSRFERLIEIVPADDEADAAAARTRFRYYRDRGYELNNHDMSSQQAAREA